MAPHGSRHDLSGDDGGGCRHLTPRARPGADGSSISVSAAGSCWCCPKGFRRKATAFDAQSGDQTGSWVAQLGAAIAVEGFQVVSLGAPSAGKGFWAVILDATAAGKGCQVASLGAPTRSKDFWAVILGATAAGRGLWAISLGDRAPTAAVTGCMGCGRHLEQLWMG